MSSHPMISAANLQLHCSLGLLEEFVFVAAVAAHDKLTTSQLV